MSSPHPPPFDPNNLGPLKRVWVKWEKLKGWYADASPAKKLGALAVAALLVLPDPIPVVGLAFDALELLGLGSGAALLATARLFVSSQFRETATQFVRDRREHTREQGPSGRDTGRSVDVATGEIQQLARTLNESGNAFRLNTDTVVLMPELGANEAFPTALVAGTRVLPIGRNVAALGSIVDKGGNPRLGSAGTLYFPDGAHLLVQNLSSEKEAPPLVTVQLPPGTYLDVTQGVSNFVQPPFDPGHFPVASTIAGAQNFFTPTQAVVLDAGAAVEVVEQGASR